MVCSFRKRLSWAILAGHVLAVSPGASAESTGAYALPPSASSQLKAMYTADQAARTPAGVASMDWRQRMHEDADRARRVKDMLASVFPYSGEDYYHAAMILQHAPTPEDTLLAHDLSVLALAHGERRGLALAAKSLDRYLRRTGSRQRYGTQFSTTNGGPSVRDPIDGEVPEWLSAALDVPRSGMPPGSPASATQRQPGSAQPRMAARRARPAAEELAQMMDELEADMSPANPGKTDWNAVAQRAQARMVRTASLFQAGAFGSGLDYYRGAALLINAPEADQLLAAHDLALLALAHGERRALPLAAESLDRYLKRTARLQRYATQFEQIYPNPPRLYPVDLSVPDLLRERFGLLSLAQAKARETALIEAVTKTAPAP